MNRRDDKRKVLLAYTHKTGDRIRFRSGPELVVAADGSYRRTDRVGGKLTRAEKRAKKRQARLQRETA